MLEKTFQRKVIKHIRNINGYVINFNPTAVSGGGVSDLIVCLKGIFVAIELKVKHSLQQRQALNLKHVNDAGGVGIVLLYDKDWERKIELLFTFLNTNKIELARTQTHIDVNKFLEKIDWNGKNNE